MSVYSHFLSRGKEVVFPKDTPVEITFERGHTGRRPTHKDPEKIHVLLD
jgi:hypothetical protein